MKKPVPIEQLRLRCLEFNKAHPVGTEVEFQTTPYAPWKRAVVEHQAYVLSGHTAVCFLQGVGSCFNLDFIRPVSA